MKRDETNDRGVHFTQRARAEQSGKCTGHSPFAFASCSSHTPGRCAAAVLWRAASVVTSAKEYSTLTGRDFWPCH
jgi:hypothetical protein